MTNPMEDNAVFSGDYEREIQRQKAKRQEVGRRKLPEDLRFSWARLGGTLLIVGTVALVVLSGCASQPGDPLTQAQSRLMSQCIQNFPPGWETSRVMSTCKSRVNGQLQQVRAEIDATAI